MRAGSSSNCTLRVLLIGDSGDDILGLKAIKQRQG